MARFKIEILEAEVGQWKQFNVPATSTGVPTWAVNQVVGAISISDSPTGEDAQPLVNGGTLIAGATIYARANTPTSAVANDFFFKQRLALMGNGGGGGGGGSTTSIATTSQAGLMMFGTTSGELENVVNGKAKVIGWDTATQALRDLDSRITNNTTHIGTLSNLNTTAQTNLVEAINEVNQKYVVIPFGTDPAQALQDGQIGILELA